jgi:hypothetical protein
MNLQRNLRMTYKYCLKFKLNFFRKHNPLQQCFFFSKSIQQHTYVLYTYVLPLSISHIIRMYKRYYQYRFNCMYNTNLSSVYDYRSQ